MSFDIQKRNQFLDEIKVVDLCFELKRTSRPSLVDQANAIWTKCLSKLVYTNHKGERNSGQEF